MSETLVLSVGLDSSVLDARETVLRSAGYIVVSAMSVKEALQLFQNGDFDLLVLCHTLPAKDRERMTCWIRASGSRIPVASIAAAPGDHIDYSDATIGQSSAELLAAVKHLLTKRLEQAAHGRRTHHQLVAVPHTPEVQKAPPVQSTEKRAPATDFHFHFAGIELHHAV